jgi:molybdopterin synthase catalytic subunit
MAIWNSEILITDSPLPPPPHDWSSSAGAVVDFWGVVRAYENGQRISGIEYEAHRAMAQHQMERIATQARAEFSLEEIILRHRVGFVAAGQASLFLRVSSAHRAAAFQGSQRIVAELKRKAPIWKRPLFVRQDRGLAAATHNAQPVAPSE